MNRLEALMQNKSDEFAQVVAARAESLPQNANADFGLSSGMKMSDVFIPKSLNYASHKYMFQKVVRFYSDDQCNGCGICDLFFF